MKISFEINPYSNHISVPVRINGLGPMRFMIDTGATVSAISSELASMLGVTSQYDFEEKWSVIQLPYTVGKLDRFEIGSEIILDEEVLVMDFSRILKTPKGAIIGNIGHSTLRQYITTFNYPERIFELQKEPTELSDRIPFNYIDETHLVGVPTFINETGPFDFVVDTGSGGTVISLDLAQQLDLDLQETNSLCRGVGGDGRGYLAKLDSISVNNASMFDVNVIAIDFQDISPRGRTIKHGIIGAPFLRNFILKIDYPNEMFSIYN